MSREEAERLASQIDGFVTPKEGRLLYDLATSCRSGSIVEIGSWKGRSTVWLALGAREGGCSKVYAIDPHQGSKDHREKGELSTLDEFKANLQRTGIEDLVVPLVMKAEEARRLVPCPIGLLFIDGPDRAEEIKEEMGRWLSCLAEGGVIALHDSISTPGAQWAAEDLYLSSRFADVRLRGSITYARAVMEAGLNEKVRDLFRMMVRRAEVIMGRVPYPKPISRAGRRLLDTISK